LTTRLSATFCSNSELGRVLKKMRSMSGVILKIDRHLNYSLFRQKKEEKEKATVNENITRRTE
jgi:hypothetical protein